QPRAAGTRRRSKARLARVDPCLLGCEKMIPEDISMTGVAKPFFILALLAVAWTAACSSTPKNPAPPVPVGGARSDVSALAGRWEGEDSSEATGRTGSIVCELKP